MNALQRLFLNATSPLNWLGAKIYDLTHLGEDRGRACVDRVISSERLERFVSNRSYSRLMTLRDRASAVELLIQGVAITAIAYSAMALWIALGLMGVIHSRETAVASLVVAALVSIGLVPFSSFPLGFIGGFVYGFFDRATQTRRVYANARTIEF